MQMYIKYMLQLFFYFSLFLIFPLFQNYSLAFITIPKNNGKIKINWDKKLTTTYTGLSESFEVDGWVVKVHVGGQSRDILFKNNICKEMLSRVAGWY